MNMQRSLQFMPEELWLFKAPFKGYSRGTMKYRLLRLLVSVFVAGIVQAYHGQWRKARWMPILFLFSALTFFALYFTPGILGALLVALQFVGFIALYVYYLGDAWRITPNPSFPLKKRIVSGAVYGIVFYLTLFLISNVRSRFVDSYGIPSGAMEPTIVPGDRIVVDKGIGFARSNVKRGDVIIYLAPNGVTYLKRVIGLGGDRIQYAAQKLKINGTSVETKPAPGECGDLRATQVCFSETIEGRTHHILQDVDPEISRQRSPPADVKLPPGQVFLMGDNRDDSYDSRHHGTIAIQSVSGRAIRLWGSWIGGPWKSRWERYGKNID